MTVDTAAVEVKPNLKVDIALVAVFAALIAAFSLLPPIFAIGAVPFALQLIIVMLAPLVLGGWQGALANGLYVLVGVAGLPVFAQQASGFGVILGPTGGYLIGYIVGAFVAGVLATIVLKRRMKALLTTAGLVAAAIVGYLVLHAFGVFGLMINAKFAFGKAVMITAGFLPLDIVKAVLAALLAMAVFKAFPRLAKR